MGSRFDEVAWRIVSVGGRREKADPLQHEYGDQKVGDEDEHTA